MSTSQQTKCMVYTIGHSNHTLQHFLSLLWKYGIEIVADIRSQPYSRYVPHFNKDRLKNVLEHYGIKYLYLGKELGGRPVEPKYYDPVGKVNYILLAKSEPFQQRITWLIKELPKHKIALMCGEEDPTTCHRRLLVGQALIGQGIAVYHIRGDGHIDTDDDLKKKGKFKKQEFQQLTLF